MDQEFAHRITDKVPRFRGVEVTPPAAPFKSGLQPLTAPGLERRSGRGSLTAIGSTPQKASMTPVFTASKGRAGSSATLVWFLGVWPDLSRHVHLLHRVGFDDISLEPRQFVQVGAAGGA